jgi:hypothetical protein
VALSRGGSCYQYFDAVSSPKRDNVGAMFRYALYFITCSCYIGFYDTKCGEGGRFITGAKAARIAGI